MTRTAASGPPGGSLDPGEDYESAARREVREELGIDDVELGPQIAVRSQHHLVGGRPAHQVERYYLARISPDAVDPARATQPDGIRARRWWTTGDLQTTRQTVYPVGLAELITGVLDRGIPQRPVVLTG